MSAPAAIRTCMNGQELGSDPTADSEVIAGSVPSIVRAAFRLDRAQFRMVWSLIVGHFSGWKQLGEMDADEEGYHAPGARDCEIEP
ncbi:hypothetical protein ABIA06_003243 [Bradyrhizobium yuanmingense]